MFDTKFIDDIAKKLSDLIPPGMKELKKDLEKNCRVILQSALAKLELVTREEFDVQKQVLAKTRAKVEELEKHIAKLDKHPKKGTKSK